MNSTAMPPGLFRVYIWVLTKNKNNEHKNNPRKIMERGSAVLGKTFRAVDFTNVQNSFGTAATGRRPFIAGCRLRFGPVQFSCNQSRGRSDWCGRCTWSVGSGQET